MADAAIRHRGRTMTHDEPGSGSITHWIGELARGDADEATRRLWDRYFDRLVGLARSRLRAAKRGPADEEDVALSAFDSLCRGVVDGRFPRLDGREDLWRLLATITARKATDQIQSEARLKRGGGRVIGEGDLAAPGDEGPGGFAGFEGEGPSPEFVAMMGEEIRRLFGLLPDETLRVVALLKMEGYSNEELAASLDCALRSVERKLERVRALWTAEGVAT
jgi:DNA-directed RNA polymerase specialized sigma24 family protein